MNGKGSKPRPFSVSQKTFADNYDSIDFGKKYVRLIARKSCCFKEGTEVLFIGENDNARAKRLTQKQYEKFMADEATSEEFFWFYGFGEIFNGGIDDFMEQCEFIDFDTYSTNEQISESKFKKLFCSLTAS